MPSEAILSGSFKRLCCVLERVMNVWICLDVRSVPSHHPLCCSHRSWMCEVRLLRCLCLALNKADTWISSTVLALDGHQRRSVV